jgi:hypothetical protein
MDAGLWHLTLFDVAQSETALDFKDLPLPAGASGRVITEMIWCSLAKRASSVGTATLGVAAMQMRTKDLYQKGYGVRF